MSPKFIVGSEGQVQRGGSEASTLASPILGEQNPTDQARQPTTDQSSRLKRPYKGELLDEALKRSLSGLRK